MMRYRAVISMSTFLLLHLVFLPSLVSAAMADLDEFLNPLTATVIMNVESGVLIDKGSKEGIFAGDILAAVNGQKKLYHPQTGQVIDTVTEYGSYLVVTRVKDEISYCQILDPTDLIAEGDRVHRFANVPVFFDDISGSGFKFYQSLQQKFPYLLWKDYQFEQDFILPEKSPALVIRYTSEKIIVFNQDQKILFSGRVQSETSAPPEAGLIADGTLPTDSELSQQQFLSAQTPAQRLNSNGGSWSVRRRIDLPVSGEIEALRVSDLDGDGRAEILIGMDGDLIIGHLENQQLVEAIRYSTQDWDQIVEISVLDLDDEGESEIIVSALDANKAVSRVLRLVESRLVALTDTPMLLGTFQSADGELLLIGVNDGKYLNSKVQFFSIKLVAGQLEKTPIHLDGAQQPYGVSALLDADGESWFISLSAQNKVRVLDSQGLVRWEGESALGGSTQSIKIPMPGSRNTEAFDRYFFRSRIYKTPRGTLLIAQHDDPGMFKNSPNFENGRLVELAWTGASLDKVRSSQSLGGMVVDFDLYALNEGGPQEVIAAIIYRKEEMFQKPFSGLVVISSH